MKMSALVFSVLLLAASPASAQQGEAQIAPDIGVRVVERENIQRLLDEQDMALIHRQDHGGADAPRGKTLGKPVRAACGHSFGGKVVLPAGFVTDLQIEASPEARLLLSDRPPIDSEFTFVTSRRSIDPPRRGAEDERLAGRRLEDHFFIELADARGLVFLRAGQEDAVQAAVGNRPAAGDGHALRPLPRGKMQVGDEGIQTFGGLADPEVRKASWQNRLTSPAWEARPNPGHLALVALERRGKLHALITQNIDELHQLAGTSADRIIEVHGTMRRAMCWGCGQRMPMTQMEPVTVVGPKEPIPLQEVFEAQRIGIAFTSRGRRARPGGAVS